MNSLSLEQNIELEFFAKNRQSHQLHKVEGLKFQNQLNGFHKHLIVKIKNISQRNLKVTLEFEELTSELKFLVKPYLYRSTTRGQTSYSLDLEPEKEGLVTLFIGSLILKKPKRVVRDLSTIFNTFTITISNNQETAKKEAGIKFKSHGWSSNNKNNKIEGLHNPYIPFGLLTSKDPKACKNKDKDKKVSDIDKTERDKEFFSSNNLREISQSLLNFEQNIQLKFFAKDYLKGRSYRVEGLFDNLQFPNQRNGFHKGLILKIKNISRENLSVTLEFEELTSDLKFLIKPFPYALNKTGQTFYSEVLEPGIKKEVTLFVGSLTVKNPKIAVRNLSKVSNTFTITISNYQETAKKEAFIKFKNPNWITKNGRKNLHNPYTPLTLTLQNQKACKDNAAGKRNREDQDCVQSTPPIKKVKKANQDDIEYFPVPNTKQFMNRLAREVFSEEIPPILGANEENIELFLSSLQFPFPELSRDTESPSFIDETEENKGFFPLNHSEKIKTPPELLSESKLDDFDIDATWKEMESILDNFTDNFHPPNF